ncbi:MAG: Hsp20/alpha crystallin family protein [Spirosomataceae bacterium]
MKSNIQIPQDILTAIDFANTTHGGMSEPILNITKGEDGYVVNVKAAGLEADSFQIDIVDNRLWVYHFVNLFAQRPEGLDNMQAARTLGNLFLPNDVNAEEIIARYDENTQELNIQLPYNQSKRNFRRHIDIEKW